MLVSASISIYLFKLENSVRAKHSFAMMSSEYIGIQSKREVQRIHGFRNLTEITG
jgi:hypothetical protein